MPTLTLINEDIQRHVLAFRETSLSRQEQAHSSNAPRLQDAQPSFSFDMNQHPSTLSTMAASSYNCYNTTLSSVRGGQRTALCCEILFLRISCLNFLRSGHRISQCNARGRCAKCNGKHHTAIRGIQIHRSTNPTSQRHNHRSILWS